jgi:hypothetical protein
MINIDSIDLVGRPAGGSMIFSDLPSPTEADFAKAENRFPPRIKSGADFFGIML